MIKITGTNLILISGIILFLATSCLSMKKYEERELSEIQSFLASHPDLDFELKPSGLYYLDVVVGTGAKPVTNDTAYILYTARFLNDTLFYSNFDTKDTLITPVNVGDLIPGFDEAITYMNVGGQSKFIIPSYLGFGNSGWYFPAYTPSIYYAVLVKLKPGPGAK